MECYALTFNVQRVNTSIWEHQKNPAFSALAHSFQNEFRRANVFINFLVD